MRNNRLFLIFFSAITLAVSGCAIRSHTASGNDRATPAGRVNGTPIPPELGHEVVMQAMGVLGVRYAPGGDSPKTGFDCSGLVTYAYARVVRETLPRTTGALSRTGMHVDARDLQPGDLVFYNTQLQPFSHVGIYLGDARFIHAPSSGGEVRIEDMRQRYWLRRFSGARRVTL